MNIFNNGIPLSGMMLDERVFSGRLYNMDKRPSTPAKSTVGTFRKGMCSKVIRRLKNMMPVSKKNLL
jgi:hypothetical protein